MGTRRRHFAPPGALVGVLAVVVLGGCDSRLVLKSEDLDGGLVIMLPGIDGRSFYSEAACRTVCGEDLGMSVELRDWTAPLGPLYNQTAISRNREVAGAIASRIRSYQRAHPGRPVFLIGHSGGTAIAVWVAEALPTGEQVEGIILLAASLSPGYDLSNALAHTRGGIVSFHSPLDAGLLGVGTTLIGTMDGVHGESAGKSGFRVPDRTARPAEYAKLFQIAWEPRMIEVGHGGGHFSCMGSPFIEAYVRPLVQRTAWDEPLIATVRERRRP